MRWTKDDVQKAYRRAARLREFKSTLEKQSEKDGWFGPHRYYPPRTAWQKTKTLAETIGVSVAGTGMMGFALGMTWAPSYAALSYLGGVLFGLGTYPQNARERDLSPLSHTFIAQVFRKVAMPVVGAAASYIREGARHHDATRDYQDGHGQHIIPPQSTYKPSMPYASMKDVTPATVRPAAHKIS